MAFVNLHYIRAAIEENTGRRLSLKKVRQLLLEENLITKKQADNIKPFNYKEYYQDSYSDFADIWDRSASRFPEDSYFIEQEDQDDVQREADLYAKIEKGSR